MITRLKFLREEEFAVHSVENTNLDFCLSATGEAYRELEVVLLRIAMQRAPELPGPFAFAEAG
jgi:hypothetical protein